MGFRIATRATLVFKDSTWDGAEVVCKLNAPLGAVLGMAQGEAEREAIKVWAGEAVVSWNLEDPDGQPIPCTPEKFAELPSGFQMRLYSTWLRLATGVPDPLGEPSRNGVTSPEPSAQTASP